MNNGEGYGERGYRRRRRRRKRGLWKWAAAGVLVAVLVLVCEQMAGGRGHEPDSLTGTGAIFSNGGVQSVRAQNYDSEILGSLKKMADSDERLKQILETADQYPDEMLEMVINNEETVNFALEYPEKKGNAPADSIGDFEAGTVPELLQWDERWGYTEYGDGLLGYTGCGPTALSMVIAGLTGDGSATPWRVARYAEDNGYYAKGEGTCWSLMTEGCSHFGVQGSELALDKNRIYAELEAGRPIICSMKPGDFTTKGHFIVLVGIRDGQIQVNDPNSRIRSEQLWDYETLEYQINNLWVFTRMGDGDYELKVK